MAWLSIRLVAHFRSPVEPTLLYGTTHADTSLFRRNTIGLPLL